VRFGEWFDYQHRCKWKGPTSSYHPLLAGPLSRRQDRCGPPGRWNDHPQEDRKKWLTSFDSSLAQTIYWLSDIVSCDMKNAMIFGLIFSLLALNCYAAPLQLSGDAGRAILGSINNTSNLTNSTTNDTANGLWNWGDLPVGHSINASGKLVADPAMDGGLVAIQPMSITV